MFALYYIATQKKPKFCKIPQKKTFYKREKVKLYLTKRFFMKKAYFFLVLAAISVTVICGCNQDGSGSQVAKKTEAGAPVTENSAKSVVVFYSQTGTTRTVAEEIAKQAHADAIELKMVTPYPSTYDSTIAVTREERAGKKWPALENARLDLAKYDTVYLGYPIMYGTFAPPIYTFLDSNDLSGKVLVPFCTYGSGGRKASSREVAELEPKAKVVLAFGMAHNRVSNPNVNVAEEVSAFLGNMREGKTDEMLCGGFSEQRPLAAEDSAVFATATKDYAYLNLKPLSVATQVVAGTNFMFSCTMQAFGGGEESVQVKVFRPLPGRGDPQLISVDK